MRAAVIGGGAFGCSSAIALAKEGIQVDLFETASTLLGGASANSHNRLHLGYHYLRSQETARQSITGFLSFMFEFGESVVTGFPNYYALSRYNSLTTSEEFTNFCDSVGISYREEFPKDEYLNRDQISGCFRVPEPLVNMESLALTLASKMKYLRVNVMLSTKAVNIFREFGKFRLITSSNPSGSHYDIVVDATYSNNRWLEDGLGIIPTPKHYEYVVIPEISWEARSPVGLTVMDGDFASVMPSASMAKRALVYHVKESVVAGPWGEHPPPPYRDISDKEVKRIISKSSHFFPFLEFAETLAIRKAVRVVQENDVDARLSSVTSYPDIPGYASVFSGKISTCVITGEHLVRAVVGSVV